MKKAIVIGASSGIGRAIAKVLGHKGYEVGLVARRKELLHELQKEILTKTYIKIVDVSQFSEAMVQIKELIQEMGDIDLFIINAGIGYKNNHLKWEKEKDTIDVNVLGFAAMANVAMHHFIKKNKGHLVGISSISALRGDGEVTAYSASKAFVSNYMEGLRLKMFKEKRKEITITDIKPGYVDTDMLFEASGVFWMASKEEAAHEIYKVIQKKRPHAYITKRWRLIAWAMKLAPRFIYERFF